MRWRAPCSGIGEGGTFPGGLRTAVETLPPAKRARGIALSFSGGTIGAVMMPLLLGPLAISYGWRNAFLFTGALGIIVDAYLGGHRPAAIPSGDDVEAAESHVAELRRAPGVVADLQLCAAGHLAGPGADDSRLVPGAGSAT